MGQAFLQLESGVVVAQEGGDYAAVKAALKRNDQNLELGSVKGVWKVYYRYGGEPHQVTFVCDWRDPDGTPRPLTMGLVDKVRSLDRNSRERALTEEELERKRAEQLAKHKADLMEAVIEDTTPKHGRPLVPPLKTWSQKRWRDNEWRKMQNRRRRGLDY